MVRQKLTIHNDMGIHLRPAGVIAEAAIRYNSSIMLIHQDKRVNSKSLLSILSLGIKSGFEIEVECDGSDEDAAMLAMIRVIHENDR